MLNQGSECEHSSRESYSVQQDSLTAPLEQRERGEIGNTYTLRSRTSDCGEQISNRSHEDKVESPPSENPVYINSNTLQAQPPNYSDCTVPPRQPPSYITGSHSSFPASNSADNDDENMSAIPLRRNLSYIMLDIEEEKPNGDIATESGELTYSNTRPVFSSQQDEFPDTDFEQAAAVCPDNHPYSTIELDNMYENMQADVTMESNMVYNGVYIESDVPEPEAEYIYI